MHACMITEGTCCRRCIVRYFRNPDDGYLLGPAIGAASLHMATIDARGAASMGFHLAPKYLKLDPYLHACLLLVTNLCRTGKRCIRM